MNNTQLECVCVCVCVCSLKVSSMQCACAMLSSMACPSLQYLFSPRLINDTIFEKHLLSIKLCFEFLFNFCLKNILFVEELSEIRSKIRIGLRVKYPLFLSDFN